MSESMYLIWSEEHGAWWRPAKRGYTRSIREAGRYSEEEARNIVNKANQFRKKGEEYEMMLPTSWESEWTGYDRG